MNGKQLKNSILQWAIQGKLVPQDPNDEPASVLLEKIRQEKERLIKEKKIKRDKNASIIYRGEDNSYYEKILATGEVKCIDEEVPFEIPTSWSWARLASITSILGDGIHGTPEYDVTGTVYFINGNNLSNGSIEIKADTKKVSEQEAEKHKRLLNSTTVLVSINGTLGNVAFYNGENVILGKSACYFNLMGNIDKQYIKHILETEYFTEYAKNVATGSTIKNVPLAGMRNFLIPVPPITEQHRIILGMVRLAHSIVRYNDAQTKLDLLNNVLNEKLKKSVLQEAIQGKLVPQLAEEGTAQELLEQIKAEKEKLVKEGKLKKSALNDSIIFRGDDNKYYELIDGSPVCIDEFLPFQIPETWIWCKVKDLLDIQTGASFKKEQANANKKGIRILRGGNILPNKYIFKDDDVFVSEEFVNANTILKKNCIITPAVTSLENIGKMAVIEKDYNNVSAGGFVFIISPYIQAFNHSLLLAYFLQSPFLIEAMRGITKKSGAAFYNLGKERLKELYLPLPPMAEQSRIVGKINEVLSSIGRRKSQLVSALMRTYLLMYRKVGLGYVWKQSLIQAPLVEFTQRTGDKREYHSIEREKLANWLMMVLLITNYT